MESSQWICSKVSDYRDGVAHKRSSEYLKSKTVRDQLQFLEENWDRIRKDV